MQVILAAMLMAVAAASIAAPLRAPDALRMRNGQGLFNDNCSACHQRDGAGLPGAFPNLAGSDFLQACPTCAIDFVVNGHTGRVIVNGRSYDGSMPPIGTGLTDRDIADILTYVLNSWGNHGPVVTGGEVAGVRRGDGR
jgi:mono/diheme cytochrome c family protein